MAVHPLLFELPSSTGTAMCTTLADIAAFVVCKKPSDFFGGSSLANRSEIRVSTLPDLKLRYQVVKTCRAETCDDLPWFYRDRNILNREDFFYFQIFAR
jgi:hypothetical protein